MLSRALSLATVTFLIGGFVGDPDPALAQAQNLEAGKSPSQIFAGACNACHKSPRGLLKTVAAGSLPGFLREHYTTSPDMASLLSAFLLSNGATDTRYAGTQAKPGKDEKPEAKPESKPAGLVEQLDRFGRRLRQASPPLEEATKPELDEAAKPDADGQPGQGEPRHGRNAKRLARTAEPPDAAKPAPEGQVPNLGVTEHGPDGRKSAAKQRLTKRGKPGEELPGNDAHREEAPKAAPAREDAAKGETPKIESGKSESKSDSAGIDPAKEGGGIETPAPRPDPVPPVTPAPAAVSAAASASAPNAAAETPAAAAQPAAQTVTASVPPPPPPIAPAGPPEPPISQ
jgi:hypothetical protein